MGLRFKIWGFEILLQILAQGNKGSNLAANLDEYGNEEKYFFIFLFCLAQVHELIYCCKFVPVLLISPACGQGFLF